MEEKISAKVKHRSKSIFSRVFFSRTMITFLLILLQIWAIIALFLFLEPYTKYVYIVSIIISIFLVIYVTNCKIKTEFKLVWMLPICAAPVFGVLLYIFVTINPGTIGLKKAWNFRLKESEQYLAGQDELRKEIKERKDDFSRTSHYLSQICKFPTYDRTKAEYYPTGELQWEAILKDLQEAREFIFLEYFIIEEGIMWNSILDILKKKVQEGVEVRVMYDGTCTILHVPYNYKWKLERMGIRTTVYAPIRPFLSTKQNNRDHRKILVIDGKVAYTGGVNLSDEYINKKMLYGHWKDVGIRLEGDAVNSFTLMFLQMWFLDRKGKGEYEKYLRPYHVPKEEGKTGYVIPYGDDATNSEDIAENVYMDMIHNAQNYVHIMTPYLVIDNDMLESLCFTAKKGVEVALILPHIPDKKVPWYVAKTFYRPMLEAGVKIYEYIPGFIHAKTFVADDTSAVVGSINLDYRSLYHHFECAAYLHENSAVMQVEQDFLTTIHECHLIDWEDYKRIPIRQKLIGQICKIYSPLL